MKGSVMRRCGRISGSSLLALLIFAIASGQISGAGQSASANAADGRQAAPAKGTLERITVYGRSLEGNLEGDSPDRPVVIYLPPSYVRDTNLSFARIRSAALLILWMIAGQDRACWLRSSSCSDPSR